MGPNNNNNNQQNRQGGQGRGGFGGRGNFGRGGNDPSFVKEFEETVVQINRISKKTKGGNQMRFSALVVVGDKKGKVGVGISKAKDVRNAIRKAIEAAKRRMVTISLVGTTIPYSVQEKFSAAKVLLKPAPPGSGIIAGGPMRVVLEASGIRDAVGKILGTKNKISNVYATLKALESISEMVKMKQKETKVVETEVKEVKTK
jgi:small subunit ribosomal protein S5